MGTYLHGAWCVSPLIRGYNRCLECWPPGCWGSCCDCPPRSVRARATVCCTQPLPLALCFTVMFRIYPNVSCLQDMGREHHYALPLCQSCGMVRGDTGTTQKFLPLCISSFRQPACFSMARPPYLFFSYLFISFCGAAVNKVLRIQW